jgi:hypothetical protein
MMQFRKEKNCNMGPHHLDKYKKEEESVDT